MVEAGVAVLVEHYAELAAEAASFRLRNAAAVRNNFWVKM